MKCKICGISDSKTLTHLTNHSYPPQYIGFIVNYPKSKRFVPHEKLKQILNVDKKKSKERLEIIQKKLFENQISKNKSLEGKTLNVLVENKMKDGIKLFGRTEYMTSVIFDGNTDCIGKVVQIKINSSNQNSLFGTLKENYKQKVA